MRWLGGGRRTPEQSLDERLERVAGRSADRPASISFYDAEQAAGLGLFEVGRRGRARRRVDTAGTIWVWARRRDLDALVARTEELETEVAGLRETVRIDTRTGLSNATAFDADHQQLYARRKRSEDSYAVLMADVDGYAGYHMRYGPVAAAELLKRVASAVSETVRQGDRAYRYDEQRFAVLLPGASLKEAVAAAERVRRRVERLGIEYAERPEGVATVTIGALAAGYRHPDHKALLVELDSLVAEGKRSGRNRVVWPH